MEGTACSSVGSRQMDRLTAGAASIHRLLALIQRNAAAGAASKVNHVLRAADIHRIYMLKPLLPVRNQMVDVLHQGRVLPGGQRRLVALLLHPRDHLLARHAVRAELPGDIANRHAHRTVLFRADKTADIRLLIVAPAGLHLGRIDDALFLVKVQRAGCHAQHTGYIAD